MKYIKIGLSFIDLVFVIESFIYLILSYHWTGYLYITGTYHPGNTRDKQVTSHIARMSVTQWCSRRFKDTIGNCQRPVFSLGKFQHMHTNLWKSELNWSSLQGNNNEKTPLSHEVVCFQIIDFETSNSKSEVSKSDLWKITSFPKTTSLQRELCLIMFYTINLSPLLVVKKVLMINNNTYKVPLTKVSKRYTKSQR